MKPPLFVHDASIVLLGIRGTGRSTLAFLAANFLGFKLIDVDSNFRKATGVTEQAFIAKYGQKACQEQQVQVMHSALTGHPTRTVLVCGLSAVLEQGQQLLVEFGQTHPIIYVMRDTDEVVAYLQQGDSKAVSTVIESANPIFRKITNFEFYNLQDDEFARSFCCTSVTGVPPASLILKTVERDFFQLILSAGAPMTTRAKQAQTLASLAPIELRPYTYALVIPISKVFRLARHSFELDSMADAVELVLDMPTFVGSAKSLSHTTATSISRAYFTLRRYISLPIIFHIEGLTKVLHPSLSSPSTAPLGTLYIDIFQHVSRLGPDYITLDLHLEKADIQSLMETRGRTKVIGHFFDADPEPDAWDKQARKAMLHQANELGWDLIRICQRAVSRADNTSVQRFINYAQESYRTNVPIIAYNTGALGRMSVLLNRILTPVTHPHIRNLEQLQDGTMEWMPDVPEALEVLHASSRLDALIFGILGADVQSSLSPYMHNRAFAFCGMPHIYKTFQSASMNDIAPMLEDATFGGASITHPFKTEIIPLLDVLSPAARAIGAVNTVLPLRSGGPEALLNRGHSGQVVALYGDNTDWIGIHTCIHRNLSPINAIRGRTSGLVLGAGGMARAAIYSMIYLNIEEIYIWNRTENHAEQVARQFSGKLFSQETNSGIFRGESRGHTFGPSKVTVISSIESPWPASSAPPNVVVSCIPSPTFTLPNSWLSCKTGGVLIELSYRPLNSPLLRQAIKLSGRSWITANGLQVLPEQAISQFELFTGRKAPRNLMRSEMESCRPGWSVSLHNAGFKAIDYPGYYSIHESPQVDESVKAIIRQPSFRGASVTFPHKLQISRFLTDITPAAHAVGAVNTIVVVGESPSGSKTLIGDNTDWSGILACINCDWDSSMKVAPALVWGAGGAARAACYALQTLGIRDVFNVNRSTESSRKLGAQFPELKIRLFSTLHEAHSAADMAIRIIICCIPADDVEESHIPKTLFSDTSSGVLVEMAYRPLVTAMMSVAADYPHWRVFNGKDVLAQQAFAQFRLWTGQDAPTDVMSDAMQAAVEERPRPNKM
ncbi:type I 3-dehydroquinase-domain-containing protein [Xylariales sp. AK1849]|nr:type I 3-dehydroquinase-domain-containing protein [Xylariales sp. AK1849]